MADIFIRAVKCRGVFLSKNIPAVLEEDVAAAAGLIDFATVQTLETNLACARNLSPTTMYKTMCFDQITLVV